MDNIVINRNNHKKRNGIIIGLIVIAFIIITPRIFFIVHKLSGHAKTQPIIQTKIIPISPTPAFPVPHVEGIQILDADGKPTILHGTVIPTALSNMVQWKQNQNPLDILNAKTFQTISSWHMNAVTIPISQWIYELSPSTYASMLDQAVLDAHRANLFVILSFVDTSQSGSPYHDNMLHAESVNFWQMLATHYQHDPMMFFDPIANPSYPDWNTWESGNSMTIRGYSTVIRAIRDAGAQQPIIIKPLAPIASDSTETGWKTFSSSLHDDNLIYGLQVSQSAIIAHPDQWNDIWGTISDSVPLYYDSWEISPHMPLCDSLSSTNADTITNSFLSTIAQQHASWNAADFSVNHLITDYNTLTPTTFTIGKPWVCGSIHARTAGMGETIKTFLTKSF